MRKVVMGEIVRLAGAKGWPEEDAVREVEKRRVEGGNLSLDACGKAAEGDPEVVRSRLL
jgi:hypothetical protein